MRSFCIPYTDINTAITTIYCLLKHEIGSFSVASKESSFMSYLTTELLTSLLQGKELSAFLNSYRRKYKRLHKLFQNEASLFSFYEFPKSIQQTIYTSNLIENNRDFVTRQSSKSNFPMRIRWNGSPAWSTAITTDGSPGKLIADFRKQIRIIGDVRGLSFRPAL